MKLTHPVRWCPCREAAAHVLRRITSAEAEDRLVWVVESDPDSTARLTAVRTLQSTARNSSDSVTEAFERILTKQGDDLDEVLAERMLQYLKLEDPVKFDRCKLARDHAQAERRQMQSAEIEGVGEVSLDLSEVQTTLVDVYLGKNFELQKDLGHEQFGARMAARSENFGRLRISLFGGEFEVKCVTEASLKVHGFGMTMDVSTAVSCCESTARVLTIMLVLAGC